MKGNENDSTLRSYHHEVAQWRLCPFKVSHDTIPALQGLSGQRKPIAVMEEQQMVSCWGPITNVCEAVLKAVQVYVHSEQCKACATWTAKGKCSSR